MIHWVSTHFPDFDRRVVTFAQIISRSVFPRSRLPGRIVPENRRVDQARKDAISARLCAGRIINRDQRSPPTQTDMSPWRKSHPVDLKTLLLSFYCHQTDRKIKTIVFSRRGKKLNETKWENLKKCRRCLQKDVKQQKKKIHRAITSDGVEPYWIRAIRPNEVCYLLRINEKDCFSLLLSFL